MKTPRLALLTLLACASAANASMPTWPVVDESFRAWPTITFKVGDGFRSLRCRLSECDPVKNKSTSKLYVMKQTGANEPIRATIIELHPLGKYDPRRLYGKEYAEVSKVIDSHRTKYATELSNFTLDNSGAQLVVVQGANRYPASTDIRTQYWSATGAVIAVSPPVKMADDVLKPEVPGRREPPVRRRPTLPAPPRSLRKLDSAGKWKDAITAVGEWRAVETSKLPVMSIPVPLPKLTFYCYHEKMDGDATLAAHLRKHPLIVECVNWAAPTDDATQGTDKKFKVRHHRVQFDLAYVDGRLTTMSGVSGVVVTEKTPLPDALGGAGFVKVTAVPPPAEAGDVSLALLEPEETRWLTKRQAAAYAAARTAAKDAAARKAADDQYRGFVEAQTRPEAQAAYKAARALPVAEASATLKAAVGGIEMWGGKDAKDVKSIVEPFQATADSATAKLLEIQLSKADWDLLKKKPADLKAYTDARISADGASGDGTAFDAAYVDPVALHLSVAAARAAAGVPPSEASPNPDGAPLVPLLTDDEKKLLTPSELAVYQSIFDTAKGDPKDPNLQREAARLRALIASENRGKDPAYAAPGSLDEFNDPKFPEWQRRKFCAELVKSGANLGADARAAELGGTGGALNQLNQTDGRSATPATATSSDAPADWTTEACKPYRTPPVTTGPTTKPPVTADVPVPPGVDAETKEKEKSKWLTPSLLTSAAKGALIGLLIGSLFGPVGLIAGPVLGAAMFYGLTKVTGG